MSHKVIVTGAGGQLGRELQRSVPGGWECVALSRAALDIGDAQQVRSAVADAAPALVINAAAYTAVDRAEAEREQARRINADGVAHLAAACADNGARLIHLSTDFVFDGNSARPYAPGDPTSPLGQYGMSKLAGEKAALSSCPSALVVRTAWVYSSFGGNFVKTMLRLMAERKELGVVDDQVGTPTWARGLAQALWQFAEHPELEGIYHWTDAGVCSWYDFAVAIAEEGCALGLLDRPPRVRPISGSEYPTPAVRPAFSVLDKRRSWSALGVEGVHWRSQLRAMLRELKELELD